ncbi:hypothetical protein BC826DRAFT_973791 [Russula brevipes]|nr:hypothetical protein BC826DRAFT_973791 [Russula brevipes]
MRTGRHCALISQRREMDCFVLGVHMDIALFYVSRHVIHGNATAAHLSACSLQTDFTLMGLMMLASQSLARKTGVLDHTVLRVSASKYDVRSAVLLLYTKDGGTLTHPDRNNQRYLHLRRAGRHITGINEGTNWHALPLATNYPVLYIIGQAGQGGRPVGETWHSVGCAWRDHAWGRPR